MARSQHHRLQFTRIEGAAEENSTPLWQPVRCYEVMWKSREVKNEGKEMETKAKGGQETEEIKECMKYGVMTS